MRRVLPRDGAMLGPVWCAKVIVSELFCGGTARILALLSELRRCYCKPRERISTTKMAISRHSKDEFYLTGCYRSIKCCQELDTMEKS